MRHRKITLPLAGLIVIGIAVGAALALTNRGEDATASAPQRANPSLCVLCDLTVMSDAWLTGCNVPAAEYSGTMIELSSDNQTLTIAGAYQDSLADYGYVDCLLERSRMPEADRFRLESTRALDGMQDAQWQFDDDAQMTASWTYHPDDGLNLVISER